MGDMVTVALAAGTMLLLAVVMALVLGWANRKFYVFVDPRVDAVINVLPGANCGGCGRVNCSEYAEAVVHGELGPNACTVGGQSVAQQTADIMGVELDESWPYRPAVHCRATTDARLHRVQYVGEQTCTAANLVSGVQGCAYGCLGLGDCVRVCDYDAIHIVDGLAKVDYDTCTGCGACARVCPRNIISMIPFKSEQMLVVACSSSDVGPDVKAVCKVGCIGCQGCSKRSDLFKMEDNLSHVDYDAYDPEHMEATEVAIEKCPMKGIIFVGKPSEKDIDLVKDEDVPERIEADFKTTVDDTEWRG